MQIPEITTQEVQYKKTNDVNWTTVDINPQKLGSYLIQNLVKDDQYDVRLRVVGDNGLESFSSIAQATPTDSVPLAPENPGYMEWYNEVPYHIDQPGFRLQFENEILALVGFDSEIINITDYAGHDSTDAGTAMDNAIAATPVGGTLLIPEGTTIQLYEYEITKNIRVDCRGTVKLNDYGVTGTSAQHVVKLSANVLWDGGTIDCNRDGGWATNNPTTRKYPMDIPSRCVVKNVTAINHCVRTDKHPTTDDEPQWGGYNVSSESYFENVICEQTGGRGFSLRGLGGIDDNGNITDYKGIYLYKCNVKDYQRKGFSLGGTRGWVVFDDCTTNAKWDGVSAHPEDGFLLETGYEPETAGNYNHTVYFKDMTIDEWWDSKSDGLKYRIIGNCNLKSYNPKDGFINVHIKGVFPDFVEDENALYYLRHRLVAYNSTFEAYTFDDGINPADSNAYFPIGENNTAEEWKDPEFWATDCEFTYNKFHANGHAPQGPNNITDLWYTPRFTSWYLKDCTLNTTQNPVEYVGFGRDADGVKQAADGHRFEFINVHFNGPDTRSPLYYVGDATYPVGTIQVLNPTGNIADNMIRNSDLEYQIQRDTLNGERVFKGSEEPTSGYGWQVGDLILPDLSDTSVGWECTTGGEAGVDAVFQEFGDHSVGDLTIFSTDPTKWEYKQQVLGGKCIVAGVADVGGGWAAMLVQKQFKFEGVWSNCGFLYYSQDLVNWSETKPNGGTVNNPVLIDPEPWQGGQIGNNGDLVPNRIAPRTLIKWNGTYYTYTRDRNGNYPGQRAMGVWSSNDLENWTGYSPHFIDSVQVQNKVPNADPEYFPVSADNADSRCYLSSATVGPDNKIYITVNMDNTEAGGNEHRVIFRGTDPLDFDTFEWVQAPWFSPQGYEGGIEIENIYYIDNRWIWLAERSLTITSKEFDDMIFEKNDGDLFPSDLTGFSVPAAVFPEETAETSGRGVRETIFPFFFNGKWHLFFDDNNTGGRDIHLATQIEGV